MRRLAACALAALVIGTASSPAGAAPQAALLFADRDLGEALAKAVQDLGSDTWRVDVRPSVTGAACAASSGAAPRLALSAHMPSRAELEACARTASADVDAVGIGRQAVALVVPAGSPVWSVDAAALFRALGQNSGEKPHPAAWNDIDPAYPHLPIGLLVPPTGSRAQHLFDALIMEPGCDRAAGARMPFDLTSRTGFCGALRGDIPIAQRDSDVQAVTNWATAAPPGHIAIVTITELRQLGGRAVPLLLDGALPTAANLDNGRYPATEKVQLLIVVPHAADRTRRNDARALAFDLLAEASIGPAGSLTPAGLIPLAPTDRVAARSQAIAILEQQ